MERQHFRTDLTEWNAPREACDEAEANLVSSHVTGTGAGFLHAPVLDLDFPCRLVESTTPGHFHLYLDRCVTWERYVQLLDALHDAGLIEDGFHKMSLHRGATFVRKPGVRKEATDSNSAGGAP
jgi:hypothetical protein